MSIPSKNHPSDWVINPVAFFRQIFSPKFTSADEKHFVNLAMTRRRDVAADIVTKIGLIYHIVTPLVSLSVEDVEPKELFVGFHLISLVLMSPMFITEPRIASFVKRIGYRFFLPLNIVTPVLFYAWIILNKIQTDFTKSYALGVTHLYALCNFIVMIHPGAAVIRTLTMILMSIVSYIVFTSHPFLGVLGITNILSMSVGLFITFLVERQNFVLAQKEFQLMIQAAPAKIVRQSALENNDLSQAFAPTPRHCVCISSDWRGYQALSAKISTNELSKAIGAYYEMTDKLLNEIFPDGNYYSDWIADELFVVIFAKEASEEAGLINAALKFSSELILKKQAFVREINIPINIDIGVASGVALIGMMGPSGHRKATALGDVPGQSRRYQEIGKQIRKKYGNTDRIVFGFNSLLQVTEPFDVQQFAMDLGSTVRDVAEDRVFYMQPVSVESYQNVV